MHKRRFHLDPNAAGDATFGHGDDTGFGLQRIPRRRLQRLGRERGDVQFGSQPSSRSSTNSKARSAAASSGASASVASVSA